MTKIVATINGLNAPVLAVDLPSGLNADTGRAMGALVRATRTLTFIGIKQGMHTADGVDGVGHLDRDPLGVTPGEERVPAAERIDYPSLKGLLTPRRRSAHKGHSGKVLLTGGTSGCRGPSCWRVRPVCGRGRDWYACASTRIALRPAWFNPS